MLNKQIRGRGSRLCEGKGSYYAYFNIGDTDCPMYLWYDEESAVTLDFSVNSNVLEEKEIDLSHHGYRMDKGYYWLTHVCSEDFYERDAEAQVKEVMDFFSDCLNTLKDLGLIKDRG